MDGWMEGGKERAQRNMDTAVQTAVLNNTESQTHLTPLSFHHPQLTVSPPPAQS